MAVREISAATTTTHTGHSETFDWVLGRGARRARGANILRWVAENCSLFYYGTQQAFSGICLFVLFFRASSCVCAISLYEWR